MTFRPFGIQYQEPIRHRSFTEARIHRHEHHNTTVTLRLIAQENGTVER